MTIDQRLRRRKPLLHSYKHCICRRAGPTNVFWNLIIIGHTNSYKQCSLFSKISTISHFYSGLQGKMFINLKDRAPMLINTQQAHQPCCDLSFRVLLVLVTHLKMCLSCGPACISYCHVNNHINMLSQTKPLYIVNTR